MTSHQAPVLGVLVDGREKLIQGLGVLEALCVCVSCCTLA